MCCFSWQPGQSFPPHLSCPVGKPGSPALLISAEIQLCHFPGVLSIPPLLGCDLVSCSWCLVFSSSCFSPTFLDSFFAQSSCGCCHLQSLQLQSPFLKPTSCAPLISINYSSAVLVMRSATSSPARALQWGERGLGSQFWDDFPGNGAQCPTGAGG